MKLPSILFLGLAILLAGFSANTYAEKYMYKWKGKDGEIHYSERPPKGVEFTRIKVAADKGVPAAKAPVTAQQNNAAKETGKESKYQAWKKENCKIANENLDILRNSGRIAQDDGQGGTRLMSDEEKAENIKKMEEQRDKYCESESQ